MALMEWNPAFSVKVKKFDDQHKKLVDLRNQLHDAMKAGEGNTMLGVVFSHLSPIRAPILPTRKK